MSIRNVKIKKLKNTPPFRKVALGTWDHPGDPQIYGCLEVDLTKAYVWRDRQPKAEGERAKITVMHMVARAMGLAMKKYPDLNGFVRFKKIYMRESVDMFFQVAVPHESGRTDLTGVQVLKILRQLDHLLPCILLAQHPGKRLFAEALTLNVFSVLEKPVDLNILAEQIDRIFLKYYATEMKGD